MGEGGGSKIWTVNLKFGFLDTLKVHIQSNYLSSTNLSLLQTKQAEKNSKLIFLILYTH